MKKEGKRDEFFFLLFFFCFKEKGRKELAATAAAGEREEKGKENDFCSFFELLGKRGRAMLISKVFFRFRPEV